MTFDQASGLRQLFAAARLRMLPLAAAEPLGRRPLELACALAAQGERVLILDHEWSEADSQAHARCGDLSDLVAGRVAADEITRDLAPGVRWMPVGKAFSVLDARGGGCAGLFARLQALAAPVDTVLLASGHPLALSSLLVAGCEFVVFAASDPNGLTSAYQLIKSLAVRGAQIRLVMDGVSNAMTAESACRRIESTAARFLHLLPQRGGWLPPEANRARTLSGPASTPRAAHWRRLARASCRWQSVIETIDGIGRPAIASASRSAAAMPLSPATGITVSAATAFIRSH